MKILSISGSPSLRSRSGSQLQLALARLESSPHEHRHVNVRELPAQPLLRADAQHGEVALGIRCPLTTPSVAAGRCTRRRPGVTCGLLWPDKQASRAIATRKVPARRGASHAHRPAGRQPRVTEVARVRTELARRA